MVRSHIVRERIDAPVGAVFDWVSNADSSNRWSGTTSHVIAGPRHGDVGTVRRTVLGPVQVDDEITVCERPHRLVYRIVRGLPVRHHYAEVLIEPDGEHGCVVEWSQRFESPLPGMANLLNRLAARGLRRSLPRLRAVAVAVDAPSLEELHPVRADSSEA